SAPRVRTATRTTVLPPSATIQDEESSHLRLLIFSGDTVTTQPLPTVGELAIGRSDECHINVDVPALSRKHALLRVGPPLTVEDLGSSNGTRIRGRKLDPQERAPLSHGDAIELG